MTSSSGGTATGFPAPGSAVAGAPPPLKRALTPADGVADPPRPAAQQVSKTTGEPAPAGSGARLTAAAAMVGVAAGLELAGLWSRISTGRRVTKGAKR